MHEKAPAFQFYPKDFLTSERVRLMSHTERGIYITMLCMCWLEESLPADVEQLGRLLHVKAQQFQRIWIEGPLASCFQERNGRLYNARLDAEREKQAAFRRRQSDKGKASGVVRTETNRGSTVVQPNRNRAPGFIVPPVQPDVNSSSSISDLLSPIQKHPTGVEPLKKPADPRVRAFLIWFQGEYERRRHGAKYLVKWQKDGQLVKEMLGAVEVDRLQKFAQILLSDKTDEEWIIGTDRGIGILSSKFNWLSDRLAAWEARHKEHTA